ncbi:MAG: alkyl sulfatase dimerization domain-containing protein [Actinomycetota bacterium]
MGPDVLELADRVWRGEFEGSTDALFASGDLVEVAEGAAFLPTFANVSAFASGDGLVLVDTGSSFVASQVHRQIRAWSAERLNIAIYSHGHIDHVFGLPPFEEEAATNGWNAPRVVAHEGVAGRFDRYVLTAGYNAAINRRQFQLPDLVWPTEYRFPDETYRETLDLDVGGIRFELHHARGETDDHTWTWVPDRRVLCTGDLFIWACPNAGNPQKVQRYPREWAQALREMAALAPEVLLPGHGLPIMGADRIREALTDTAALLESLHDQTVALMNEGARLDAIIHTVEPPMELMERPYLQPIYDEPEFIVRNVWRLYGGWYDGNPATLKPAPDAEVAAEVAALAGGPARLADRASALAEDGNLRLACHLVEMAGLAAPHNEEIARTRSEIYQRRSEVETSIMAKGIYAAEAREDIER